MARERTRSTRSGAQATTAAGLTNISAPSSRNHRAERGFSAREMRLNRGRDGNNGKRANAAAARLIRGGRKQPFFPLVHCYRGGGGGGTCGNTRILSRATLLQFSTFG